MKNRILITTGVILIFLGIALLLNDFVKEKRDMVFSEINLDLLKELQEIDSSDDNPTSSEVIEEPVEPDEEPIEEKPKEEVKYEYYIATLDIPKASISRGFYDKDSSLNKVSLNIQFLPESDYPDKVNGNVILAAHSGNYYNSYFTNLNKLVIGDKAYIKYKGIMYTYKIVNIYNVGKTGTVSIYRNINKSTLTMVTCDVKNKKEQTVYIAELISKE